MGLHAEENTVAEAAARSESDRDHLREEICGLGLQGHIADLDAHGYTVVPPEIASPNGLAERMLEACLDVAERRNGERPRLENGSIHSKTSLPATAQARGRGEGRMPATAGSGDSPFGDAVSRVLLEDPVFEESLMNPVLLALATYLCGYNMVMSSMSCFFKGPNRTPAQLHTDTRLPTPLPVQALVCKCMYLLTDFSRDKGCTVFVPGSHQWCRNPVGSETLVGGSDQAVPVEAAAGSLVVFHGNTWHGACHRSAPGLRVSVHLLMVRPIIRAREDHIGRIPQQVLDRNPARFAILTQQGLVSGSIDPDDQRAKVLRSLKYISAYEKESGVRLPVKDSS